MTQKQYFETYYAEAIDALLAEKDAKISRYQSLIISLEGEIARLKEPPLTISPDGLDAGRWVLMDMDVASGADQTAWACPLHGFLEGPVCFACVEGKA